MNPKRCKTVGDMGEGVVPMLLARAGFTNIVDLNGRQMNHPFADFLAEKDGVRYAISVKARNKFQRDGTLNPRYKLGKPARWPDLAERVARELDAVPAFVAIAFEDETFDAYFGEISILSQPLTPGGRALNGDGIQMTPKHTARYLCLALAEPHGFDSDEFSNAA